MFTKEPVAVEQMEGQPRSIQTTNDETTAELMRSLSVKPYPQDNAIPPQLASSSGLAQMFGLDPRVAILTVLVDLMVFGGDTFSFEILVPLGACIAAALGLIVYKAQRKWYGDDHETALIKSLMIALLTAIPVPLSPFIAIPGGIVGIVKAVRRK